MGRASQSGPRALALRVLIGEAPGGRKASPSVVRRAQGENAEGRCRVDASVIRVGSGFTAERRAMAGTLVRKAADYVRSKEFRDYLMR